MAPVPSLQSPSTIRYPQPRVLLLEPHPDTRELYALWLTYAAFSVSHATGGADAVTLARALQPDVILLEPFVPGGGMALVRTLRNEPACADAVLVVVTTDANAVHRCDALEAGADAYLVKPCSLRDVAQAIADACDQRLLLIGPGMQRLTPPPTRLWNAVQRCRAIHERFTTDDASATLIGSTGPEH
jgi:CheY-like chemotaxis protein